jgi:hypothetical protein
VFIFGDLNFRIELPNEIVRPLVINLTPKNMGQLKASDELI